MMDFGTIGLLVLVGSVCLAIGFAAGTHPSQAQAIGGAAAAKAHGAFSGLWAKMHKTAPVQTPAEPAAFVVGDSTVSAHELNARIDQQTREDLAARLALVKT